MARLSWLPGATLPHEQPLEPSYVIASTKIDVKPYSAPLSFEKQSFTVVLKLRSCIATSRVLLKVKKQRRRSAGADFTASAARVGKSFSASKVKFWADAE
jgi:hypothetical protein